MLNSNSIPAFMAITWKDLSEKVEMKLCSAMRE